MEQAFDLLRMVSHVIESVEERATKILRSFKEPIVCDMLARVMPETIQAKAHRENDPAARSLGYRIEAPNPKPSQAQAQ
jgi:hypothetical protein